MQLKSAAEHVYWIFLLIQSHKLVFLFVRTFIDIIHYKAAYRNPNRPN